MAARSNTYRRAFSLLDRAARRQFAFVGVLVVLMAVFETIGVSSIVPFLSVIADPKVAEDQPFLSSIYRALDFSDTGSFLRFLGGVSFSLLIASAFVRSWGTYVLSRFAQMLRHTIGARLLDTYLRRPYEFFLDRHSGDLAKTILSETDQLVASVYQPATTLISNAVTMLALTGLVVVVDPVTALVVALVLGLTYAIIYFGVRRPLGRIGRERLVANQARFEATSESLNGIKDIKLLGREASYLDRFASPSSRLGVLFAKSLVLGVLPKYFVETIGFGGILLLSMSLMTSDGDPSADALGAGMPLLGLYALAGYRMLPAFQAIYYSFSQMRFGAAAIDAVYDDLKQDTPLPELSRPAPLGMRKLLQIQRIVYRYPNSEVGLDDISFDIPAGSTVGIVGTTGAGKTTLVDVLLGLLWPREGQLVADGCPITTQNVRAWQASIGYVPQDIFLADATLRENIALGIAPGLIDDERVRECARLAQMDQYVDELPDRYETAVGERGVRLSGGQRQRIGIARALYHDPDVLVFDEATSALDNLTERALMDAVLALQGTKTIIMIAHRLSTVRACDQIVVLERGRVVGIGTYDELAADNAVFRSIANASGT